MQTLTNLENDLSFEDFKTEVINDYKIAVISRECSLLGRREVLTAKPNLGFLETVRKYRSWPWPRPLKKAIGVRDTTETKPL